MVAFLGYLITPLNTSFQRWLIWFVLQMGQDGSLPLSAVRIFVLDECDKMLDSVGEPWPCIALDDLMDGDTWFFREC